MKVRLAFSRRARWAVPTGAVAAVAVVAVASAITVAQAAPALPAPTPAQLLADVAGQTAAPPPLTGTVVETASLGIPQLPGADDPTSVVSLLTGSHTLRIWYADPEHLRLAVPVTMGESDLIRNGNTVWYWQSSSNTATKLVLPAHPHEHMTEPKSPLTPAQAAKQILAAVGPTTRVTTQTNITVAGQAAYQLVLAPKDARSLIGKITIALDGQHPNVPLRVQVFARGATAPGFSVGYTAISFVRPAAGNFDFKPPAGAHVSTAQTPGRWYAYAPLSGSAYGPGARGWTGSPPPDPGRAQARLLPSHPIAKLKKLPARGSLRIVNPPAGSPPPSFGTMPQLLGKDWLSVLALPDSALGGLAGQGNAASAAGQAARSIAGSGGPVANSAVMAALLRSAQPVHGSWGSGKLLHTSLFSILLTNNGHALIGAVVPSVLYADAAHVK